MASAAAAAAVSGLAAAVTDAALVMAALRSLLQYSDTERKWLFAEDGDVERHLSPAGLRNAAVWRTTETFSAEPFTHGMMDAPDSALGMDLAYLVRLPEGQGELVLFISFIYLLVVCGSWVDVKTVLSMISLSACSCVRDTDCERMRRARTDSLLVTRLMVLYCLFLCCSPGLMPPILFFPAGALFLRQWPHHGPREHGHSLLHLV